MITPHCEICAFQGRVSERKTTLQGLSVCHQHELDIREEKIAQPLLVQVLMEKRAAQKARVQ